MSSSKYKVEEKSSSTEENHKYQDEENIKIDWEGEGELISVLE